MKLTNKVYDAGKFIAQIVLPAIATLYFGLSELWHLPYAGEIVGTITTVDVFLGSLLQLSSSNYKARYDGAIEVEGNTYTLALNDAVETIPTRDKITFKVVNK